jgi:RNA polymerase sigma-70 factor (ECF subfamily)
VVRSLGVRDADVEDVCQEAFLVVHRRLGTFEGKSSVRTWVYGICIRVASDYRKRAHHKREQVVDEMPDAAVVGDQDQELEQRRALAWLDGVLDSLDESKRAAFVLSDIEEVPMSEIAEALSCPLQTAYARVYAARRHIDAAARREKAKRS